VGQVNRLPRLHDPNKCDRLAPLISADLFDVSVPWHQKRRIRNTLPCGENTCIVEFHALPAWTVEDPHRPAELDPKNYYKLWYKDTRRIVVLRQRLASLGKSTALLNMVIGKS
jgi:hypothetical protein